MHDFTEQNILVFLVQLFLLLGLARLGGELFRRWKQPALTAEILIGVLLGPTVFGRLSPSWYERVFPSDPFQQGMLGTLAWLGLFFFLLETGLKMDFSAAWRHRGNALKIAVADIIVPMGLGFALCMLLPDRFLVDPSQRVLFSLFMATVLTISAMPITIRALSDLNIAKTDLGYLIMSALSVNEIIGWVIFAFVLGAFSHSHVDPWRVVALSAGVVVFTAVCLSAGRRVSGAVISRIRAWGMPEPGTSLTFICLLGFLCGAFFQKIGLHALLGFFIAGVMVGEARELPERTRQVISQMVYALFVPLFFVGIGLRVDFLRNFNVWLVVFVTLVGVFGKFLGAWLGALFTTLSRANRLPLAIAHTPGGSMEIIIAILALEYGLIDEPMFVAIVVAGIISSAMLGPWLKYSLTRRKEVSALELFTSHEVVVSLKATTKEEAIAELCQVAAEPQNMPNAQALAAQVCEREALMSTAMEEGIALPHARLRSLIKPLIVFGRSVRGVEWNSSDGKPAQLIFLILTPRDDDEVQVQVLRILAKTLSDESLRRSLLEAASREDLWQLLHRSLTSHRIIRN